MSKKFVCEMALSYIIGLIIVFLTFNFFETMFSEKLIRLLAFFVFCAIVMEPVVRFSNLMCKKFCQDK